MEDNPAPGVRPLINGRTYRENFSNRHANQTYLCYEATVQTGGTWALAPVEEPQGIRSRRGPHRGDDNGQREPGRHAELNFLDRVRSWALNRRRHYRLTCYMSWSPCPDCAQELVAFLRENSHVSLRISAAGIHTALSGYEHGLCALRDAWAELAIMTPQEHEHCWETFVDNEGRQFRPWPDMGGQIEAQCQILENILWN